MMDLHSDPRKRALELLWPDLDRHNLNNEDSTLVFTAIVGEAHQ
jgi:hypothetical protein